MTDTVNLGLPCIEGSQAQKHVTHNDALRILDTLVQLAVLDRDLTEPPGAPAEGDRYIVMAGATGAWVGHDHAVAAWQDDGWQFSAPRTGWLAYVADEGVLLVWNGGAWLDVFSVIATLQNLTLLGIGTTADRTNPLSVKLNNALFAARTVAEGGDGNLRYKLNKESAAKTLSILFQDNWSGRAEIGLTGDDDFHFKVSPDGGVWHEAIRIDRASGKVSYPVTGGPRELLTADRTYYVRSDGSDTNNGLNNSAGGAFLTIQAAIDTIAQTLDIGGRTVIIQVAPGSYIGNIVLKNVVGFAAPGNLVINGDQGAPGAVVLGTTSGNLFLSDFLGVVWDVTGVKITAANDGINVAGGLGGVRFGAVEFGVCGGDHLRAADNATLRCLSSYTISGSAMEHIRVVGSVARIEGVTVTLAGAPAFSTYAAAFRGGLLMVSGAFVGSATGTRYSVTMNGVIDSNGGGINFLPGSVAGVTATGGVYG